MPGVKQKAAAGLPPYAQWFQLVDPGLLTNKTIRQYLLVYNAEQWPEVVKLTLLYGILALHKQYGPQALTLRELQDIVGQNKVAAAVEQSIPGIEKQLADLRAEVLSFQQDLGGGNAQSDSQVPSVHRATRPAINHEAAPPVVQARVGPATQQPRVSFAEGVSSRPEPQPSQPPPATQRNAVKQFPPEHGNPRMHFQRIDRTLTSNRTGGAGESQVHFANVVRQPVVRGRAYIPSGKEALAMALKQAAMAAAKMHGEVYEPGEGEEDESAVNYPDWYGQHASEASSALPSGPIYPDWWGHEVFVPPPRKAKKAPRPPPRLAYSVPREDPRARQLYEDDLVTAEYLQVPGSGYGQAPRQQMTSATDADSSGSVPRGVPVVARRVAVPASTLNATAGGSVSGDPKQSSGWATTIPVAETKKGSRGRSVAGDRTNGATDGGAEAAQGIAPGSGAAAAVKKKGPVRSRVRAEIEAQRRYEEQRSAARLQAAQELLSRPRRRMSGDTSSEPSAATSPQSVVGRIADQFLGDPWMSHFQDASGSTAPAFDRFGLGEPSSPPSFVPSGTLLAAAAAASVLLNRQNESAERIPPEEPSPQTVQGHRIASAGRIPPEEQSPQTESGRNRLAEQSPESEYVLGAALSARSSSGDSRRAVNRRYEEPQNPEEVPPPLEEASGTQAVQDDRSGREEEFLETGAQERIAAEQGDSGQSLVGALAAAALVGEVQRNGRGLGTGGTERGEVAPVEAPRGVTDVMERGSVRSDVTEGSGRTSGGLRLDESRGLPGGRTSEASESSSLSSFTSFTTTGSVESET